MKIGFIGAGNLASHLIHGLVNTGVNCNQLYVSNRTPEKCQPLVTQFNINATTDNNELVKQCDIVIIAVKPKDIIAVLQQIRATLLARQSLLISVAAGITTQQIQQHTDANLPVIRAMPNVAASQLKSMTVLYQTPNLATDKAKSAEFIFKAIGDILWVQEECYLDAATAICGTGPALFFYLMEHMVAAAMQLGFTEIDANHLVKKTAEGATLTALQHHSPLHELRRQVTSPGGTTAAAINVLESNGVAEYIQQALQQAKQRATALGKEQHG